MLRPVLLSDVDDILTIAFYADGKLYDIVAGQADDVMRFLYEIYH